MANLCSPAATSTLVTGVVARSVPSTLTRAPAGSETKVIEPGSFSSANSKLWLRSAPTTIVFEVAVPSARATMSVLAARAARARPPIVKAGPPDTRDVGSAPVSSTMRTDFAVKMNHRNVAMHNEHASRPPAGHGYARATDAYPLRPASARKRTGRMTPLAWSSLIDQLRFSRILFAFRAVPRTGCRPATCRPPRRPACERRGNRHGCRSRDTGRAVAPDAFRRTRRGVPRCDMVTWVALSETSVNATGFDAVRMIRSQLSRAARSSRGPASSTAVADSCSATLARYVVVRRKLLGMSRRCLRAHDPTSRARAARALPSTANFRRAVDAAARRCTSMRLSPSAPRFQRLRPRAELLDSIEGTGLCDLFEALARTFDRRGVPSARG